MKILISGGHLMPALALIDKLIEQKNIDIVFVGRKYNFDGEQSFSLEFQEIEKRKIKFIPFVTGRFQVKDFLLILKGLWNSLKIIRREKPNIIFSFGSFIGFPFTLFGFIYKIPVYIHEQTLNPGFANRVSSFFARKIFVSFPQSAKFFNQKKVIISGNLVRNDIFKIESKIFNIDKNSPVIYITGGSLGSHSINMHIAKILPQLLKKYIVVHQTGNVNKYQDYKILAKIQKNLPQNIKSKYFLCEHIYSNEIGYVFSLTDLVISRSGANTFFELIALKKPAILIPLPWSARTEQQKHAALFTNSGLGEVFSQFDESEKLLHLIDKMMNNLKEYQNKFTSLKFLYKQDAVKTIYQHILK